MSDEVERLEKVVFDCDRALAALVTLPQTPHFSAVIASVRERRGVAANRLAEIEADALARFERDREGTRT